MFNLNNKTSDSNTLSSPLTHLINKLYDRCINGGYGFDSSYQLASSFRNRHLDTLDKIDDLIKQESSKSALSGAITGLGGIVSLPVTIPTNLISTLFIQMRLITTIAILNGHDLKEERIKATIYLCLCIVSSKQVLQHLCLDNLMKQNHVTISQLIQKITNQLITTLSAKHSFKIIKLIPFIGSLTGGAIDYIITYRIGNYAKNQFKKLSRS